MFKDFQTYSEPENCGVRLPKISVSKQELAAIDSKLSESSSSFDILKALVRKGILEKGINKWPNRQDYYDRAKQELDTFEELGFTDYVLLNWDIIGFCHKNNITVAAGRGSAPSSMVLYLLKVTDLDPIENELFFERFVSKSRAKKVFSKSGEKFLVGDLLPDVDSDIAFDQRHKVISYIEEKHKGRTSKILTFGTFSSKVCIKEAAKYFLEYDETTSKEISDLIPKIHGVVMGLEQSYNEVSKFKEWADKNPIAYKNALKVEDLIKNVGCHASGIAICAETIADVIPLQKTKEGEIISGYDMKGVADLMVKFDILGLRTLTVARKTCERLGINLSEINPHDPFIYQCLQDFKNKIGIFQISADVNHRVCQEIKPLNLGELADVVALARPSSLQFVSDYKDQKLNPEPLGLHPELDKILASSKNVMLFQESQMAAVSKVFGMTLEDAEQLRRCVTGDTRFLSKSRGWIKIETLLKEGYKDDLFWIMSPEGFGQWKPIRDIWSNGVRQVVYVEGESGLTVKATQYHQFATQDGWKARRRLSSEDNIICSFDCPTTGERSLSLDWAIVLAGMMTEGYFVYGNTATFTNFDQDIYDRFYQAACNCFGEENLSKAICGRVIRFKKSAKKELSKHLKQGKSAVKDIPEIAFRQDKEWMRHFIGFTFACEGTITEAELSLTSKAFRICHKLQLILSQFGLRTFVNIKNNPQYGDYKVIYISGTEKGKYLERFSNEFGFLLQSYKLEKIQKYIENQKAARHSGISQDMFPKEFTLRLLNQYPQSAHNLGEGQRIDFGCLYLSDIRRKKFQTLAARTGDPYWVNLSNGRQVYNKIIQEYRDIREVEVFDFTVDEETPYILANGIVIHNCIGKKLTKEIPAWKDKIFNAAEKNNVSKEAAEYFWRVVEASGNYSFNKSHAYSAADLGAKTTYLKFKHPQEFFISLLESAGFEQDPLAEISAISKELCDFGIKLLPPSLEKSEMTFSIDGPDIRYGLSTIKGVSSKALEALVDFRGKKFANKYEIFVAAKVAGINISVLAALIQAGTMDSSGHDRSRMVLEAQAFNLLTEREKRNFSKGGERFGYDLLNTIAEVVEKKILGDDNKPIISEKRFITFKKDFAKYRAIYNQNRKHDKFAKWYYETSLLGYSYSHELKDCFVDHFGVLQDLKEIADLPDRGEFKVAGQVDDFYTKTSAAGNKYMSVTVSDNKATQKFLLMDNRRAANLTNFLDTQKLVKKDIIIINGSKSGDTFFVNSIDKVDCNIYLKSGDIKKTKND